LKIFRSEFFLELVKRRGEREKGVTKPAKSKQNQKPRTNI
jgi:hypothetical protein